jgi:hypothetical protein
MKVGLRPVFSSGCPLGLIPGVSTRNVAVNRPDLAERTIQVAMLNVMVWDILRSAVEAYRDYR